MLRTGWLLIANYLVRGRCYLLKDLLRGLDKQLVFQLLVRVIAPGHIFTIEELLLLLSCSLFCHYAALLYHGHVWFMAHLIKVLLQVITIISVVLPFIVPRRVKATKLMMRLCRCLMLEVLTVVFVVLHVILLLSWAFHLSVTCIVQDRTRGCTIVAESCRRSALVFTRLLFYIYIWTDSLIWIKRLIDGRVCTAAVVKHLVLQIRLTLLLSLEFFPVNLAHLFGWICGTSWEAIVIILSLRQAAPG